MNLNHTFPDESIAYKTKHPFLFGSLFWIRHLIENYRTSPPLPPFESPATTDWEKEKKHQNKWKKFGNIRNSPTQFFIMRPRMAAWAFNPRSHTAQPYISEGFQVRDSSEGLERGFRQRVQLRSSDDWFLRGVQTRGCRWKSIWETSRWILR